MNEENLAQLDVLVRACGCEVYDVSFVKENKQDILRISIVNPIGDITLEQCQIVSERISPWLDVIDVMPNSYILEVSSAGVERILTTPRHFRFSLNEQVSVKLNDKSEFIGIIESCDENSVSFIVSNTAQHKPNPKKQTKTTDSAPKEIRRYLYGELKKVKTIFEW